jgi:hypothetical protein
MEALSRPLESWETQVRRYLVWEVRGDAHTLVGFHKNEPSANTDAEARARAVDSNADEFYITHIQSYRRVKRFINKAEGVG